MIIDQSIVESIILLTPLDTWISAERPNLRFLPGMRPPKEQFPNLSTKTTEGPPLIPKSLPATKPFPSA